MENLGPGMDKLPAKGADLMIFPIHLKDGSGGPSRVIAVLPKDCDVNICPPIEATVTLLILHLLQTTLFQIAL